MVVALLQNCKKHIPWVAAAVGCALALSRDCTLNAYASSARVDKVERRVDAVEDRLTTADRELSDKLDSIYHLLLERRHDVPSYPEYCR